MLLNKFQAQIIIINFSIKILITVKNNYKINKQKTIAMLVL